MEKYSKISLFNLLDEGADAPCDVFVQLGPKHFEKVVPKGSKLDFVKFKAFESKGINNFWIENKNAPNYLKQVQNKVLNLTTKIQKSKSPIGDIQFELKPEDAFNIKDPKTQVEFDDLIDKNLIHANTELLRTALSQIRSEKLISEDSLAAIETVAETLLFFLSQNQKPASKIIKSAKRSDGETKHHLTTAVFSVLLARADGQINRKLLEIIATTSLIHDCGWFHHDQPFDERSPQLNAREKYYLHQHSILGARFGKSTQGFTKEIATTIEQHHENWDGSGFPRGLQGKDIYYPARVLMIADEFVNLTTSTSKRKALPPRLAFFLMRREKKLDPDLLEIFCRLFGESAAISERP